MAAARFTGSRWALAVVALLLAACAGQSVTTTRSSGAVAPDPLLVERGTDTTRVRTPALPVAGPLKLYAGFKYPGKEMTAPPDSVYLVFQETSQRARWESPAGRTLVLRLDDSTQLSVDRTEYLTRVQKAGPLVFTVDEWVWVTLPRESFVRIASAKRVEGRLGHTEFALSSEHLAALRELAARLTPPNTAGTAP